MTLDLENPNLQDSVLDSINITGVGFERTLFCPICSTKLKRTLTPHLRKEHPREWDELCLSFLELYNSGLGVREIMRRFNSKGRLVCTWGVIENEVKRIAEQKGIVMKAPTKKRVDKWEPDEFKLETDSMWDFPQRGNWAVHDGNYRGNWSPYVPRNIILQYSRKGDWVLDPFMGAGTTLIESWLLGRNCVGVDVSPHAVNMTNQKLREMRNAARSSGFTLENVSIEPKMGDARNLGIFDEGKFDLICTHPPYADALRYTYSVDGDLSHVHNVEKFCNQLSSAAKESLRCLKAGKICAIMIGDIRRNGKVIPLGMKAMEAYLGEGFELQEIIIKKQHHDSSSEFFRGRPRSGFRFRITHEYLFVFRKPNQRSR